MTKRPARQLPASRRCPPPATGTREEQPPRDGPTGPEADLDAHIARLVADAPPLTSAQRDQLALILRRSAATGTKPPDRPVQQCAVPTGPASPGPATRSEWTIATGIVHRSGLSRQGQQHERARWVAVHRGPPPHPSWRPWAARARREGRLRDPGSGPELARAGRPELARTGPGCQFPESSARMTKSLQRNNR